MNPVASRVAFSPSREVRGTTTSLTARLRNLRDALLHDLVERDVAVRLALLAALSGEHLLLVGPPGTAKSLVASRLRHAFAEASYFERLLTRFTVPEELFGPLSIKRLEEDRYERLVESYLPSASVAFLDEIFKANSAVLNALLTLLNERQFDNGTRRIETPLISVIGASNELPEGAELDALYDRFLLRLHVGPISSAGFPTLLGLAPDAPPILADALKLTGAELRTIRKEASEVAVPIDVIALLSGLREWCAAEGIFVSDRRWRKIVKLLRVSAYSHGRKRVSIWDCWLLQHCTWAAPEQREKVFGWYAERVGASEAMDPSRLTRIVVALEQQLEIDQSRRSQMTDPSGRPLFLGANGSPTTKVKGMARQTRDGEELFLAPAGSMRREWPQKVEDRTNEGKGYTREELRALNVRAGYMIAFDHWDARDAYLADRNNWLMTPVDRPPAMEPARHKSAYIEAQQRELSELRGDVDAYMSRLRAHIASVEDDIRGHLWVASEFVEPAARNLEITRRTVEGLVTRIDRLRAGFERLPREEEVASRAIDLARGEP